MLGTLPDAEDLEPDKNHVLVRIGVRGGNRQ